MAGKENLIKTVQGGVHCRNLYQYIRTIDISLHHAADPADLAFYPVQAMNQVAVLFILPLFPSLITAFFFLFNSNPPSLVTLIFYTPMGYIATIFFRNCNYPCVMLIYNYYIMHGH